MHTKELWRGAQIQVGEPQVGTREHPLQALVKPPLSFKARALRVK